MQFNHRLAGDRRERSGHADLNVLTGFHASLMEVLPHAAVFVDREGNLLGHNSHMASACEAHGLESVPLHLKDFLSDASLKRCEPVLAAAFGGVPSQASGGLKLKSGVRFCRQLICTSFLPGSGEFHVVLAQFVKVDIAQTEGPLEECMHRDISALVKSGGAVDVLKYFPDDVLMFHERETPEDMASKLLERVNSDYDATLLAEKLTALGGDQPRSFYIPERTNARLAGKSSDRQVCEVRLIPIPDHTTIRTPKAFMAIVRRNVDCPEEIAENRRLAYQDPLTGLENRRSFIRSLTQQLALFKAGRARETGLAVFYIDLDEFKKVNDLGGHETGDDMLMHVATCLRRTLGHRGLAARIGGDEFAGMAPVESKEDALLIGERILEEFDRIRLEVGNRIFTIGGSIGVAFIGGDVVSKDLDAAILIGLADQASLRGKRFGGRSVQVHTVLSGDCRRRGPKAADIPEPDSFLGHELALYAMPIRILKKDSVLGYKMHLRLQGDRARGLSSRAWVSAAERSGFIARVDAWTLDRVLDAADRNPVRETLTMNISAESARDPEFRDGLVARLSVNPLLASRLCLEIAEKDFLREPAQVEAFFKLVSELGCQTAIDDFAGHWPTLSRLTGVRVDWLKLEPGLTRQAAETRAKAGILAGLVNAAHALGVRIIAKHVETAEEANLLSDLNIDAAKGGYFGKSELWPEPWASSPGRARA